MTAVARETGPGPGAGLAAPVPRVARTPGPGAPAVARETAQPGPDPPARPDCPPESAASVGVARETAPPDPQGSPPPSRSPLSRGLAAVVLAPIRVYRRLISPLLGPRCRYYPTCSAYAEQAVRELGPVRGTILAVWRVLRCNPLSSGGLDPLENRRLFRSKHPADRADGPEATD